MTETRRPKKAINICKTISIHLGLPLYAISIGVVSLKGDQPEVVVGSIYNPVCQ